METRKLVDIDLNQAYAKRKDHAATNENTNTAHPDYPKTAPNNNSGGCAKDTTHKTPDISASMTDR